MFFLSAHPIPANHISRKVFGKPIAIPRTVKSLREYASVELTVGTTLLLY